MEVTDYKYNTATKLFIVLCYCYGSNYNTEGLIGLLGIAQYMPVYTV